MKKSSVRSSLTRLTRFKAAFKKHFFLRFHMILILTGVFSLGLILSKLFLEVGVRSMLIRYPIVLALSYLMFFVFIKLWLLYIQRRNAQSNLSDAGSCDAIILPDGGGAPIGDVADLIKPGGGEFGGGGASGDFDSVTTAADVPDSTGGLLSGAAAPQSSGSSCLPDIPDIDDGAIVLIVLGILLALILGVGLYLVYAAPTILSDAALQAIMASSLYRASKRMDSPDWVGGIFKVTWIPFTIMAILTIAIALVATHYCPGASKLSDVVRSLWHSGSSQSIQDEQPGLDD
jgi:hypothetical protein